MCPCGPWRPVRLELIKARVSELRIDYQLSDDYNKVAGVVKIKLEGLSSKPASLTVLKDKQMLFQRIVPIQKDGMVDIDFTIEQPALWNPHGYGEQHLYDFRVAIVAAGANVSIESKKVGFRRAELIQEPDEIGKSFYFRVNGYDVFCGGSDWIPADSFTPRVNTDRYRKWLQTMVDGHQSMIR